METIKNSIIKYKIVIFIFLLSFIPRFVCNLYVPFISIISDEVSTISSAAIFAGYDWSNVVSLAGYYGGGMTVFFAPILRFVSNPIIAFQIIINILALLQASTSLICYKMLKNFFKIDKFSHLVLLSILGSYIVTRRATNVTNESMLIFLTWLLLYILLRLHYVNLNNQFYKRRIYSIILAIIVGYSLTVHTRSITFILGMLFLFIIYYIIYKKCLFSPLFFLVPFIITYFGGYFFIEYVKSSNAMGEAGAIVRNDSVPGMNKLIFSPDYWFSLFTIIVGQLTTISVFTAGLFIFTMILFFHQVIQIINRRDLFLQDDVYSLRKQFLFIIFFFLIPCVAITIVGQSLSWLVDVKNGIDSGTGTVNYGLKALTYIRYFGPYVSPLIVGTLLYFLYIRDNLKLIVQISVISLVVLYGLFIFCCVPYLYNNPSGKEAFLPFTLQSNNSLELGRSFYLFGIFISSLVTMVFLLFYVNKKHTIWLIIIIIFMGYQYVYNIFRLDIDVSHKYTDTALSTYYSLEKVLSTLPNQIYVEDLEKQSDHQIYYTYQFLFKDKQVIPTNPSVELDEVIYISNGLNSNINYLENGFKLVKTEGTNYILIKGSKIEETFIKNGYFLTDFDSFENDINVNIINNNNNDSYFETEHLSFEKGTYEIKFDSQLLNQKNAVITLGSSSRKIEYNIKDLTNNKINISFFSNFDNFRVNIYNCDLSIDDLQLSYRKISNEYKIEYDLDSKNIINYIKSKSENENIYFFNIDQGNLNRLKNLTDTDRVKLINYQELISSEEEIKCTFIHKDSIHKISVLKHYNIVESFQNYYIIEYSNNIDDFNLSNIKSPTQNVYNKLVIGDYKIKCDLSNFEKYQICADGYQSAIYDIKVTDEYITFSNSQFLTNWYILLYDNQLNKTYANCESIESVNDVMTYLEDVIYVDQVKDNESVSFVDQDISNDELLQSIVDVFSKKNIKFKKVEYLIQYSDTIDSEFIILNRFMSNYGSIFNNYELVDSNERYMLFKKIDNKFEQKIAAKHFQNQAGRFSLPNGTYEAFIQIDTDQKGELGSINIFNNNDLITQIMVNTNDVINIDGNLYQTVYIQSYDGYDNIRLEGNDPNNVFEYNLKYIKYISQNYTLDLSNSTGGIIDTDGLSFNQAGIFDVGYFYMNKGTYEINIDYATKSNNISIVAMYGEVVLNYCDTKENENSMHIILKPTNTRKNCYMRISLSENDELLIKDISIKRIL